VTTWTLIQIVFDIFFALGVFVIVMRLNRAPKDDPRLSRGLQLLQSKIAVLEDLSDRTDAQVQQLMSMIEQKSREVQAKIHQAEQTVNEIRVSTERSLDVAKIFQDKIPHQEIIERQNTIKYVTAARLAHQGVAVDEILNHVDLPKGEIEFIASVNRDRLMFNEDQLPDWARAPYLANPTSTATFVESPPPVKESDDREQLLEKLGRLQRELNQLDHHLAHEAGVRKPVAPLSAAKQAARESLNDVRASAMSDAGASSHSAAGVVAVPVTLNAAPKPATDLSAPPPTQSPLAHSPTALEGRATRTMAQSASVRPAPQAATARQGEAAPSPHHVMSRATTNRGTPVVKRVLFPKIDA
jgi:cell division septum initiation protein DivIVA